MHGLSSIHDDPVAVYMLHLPELGMTGPLGPPRAVLGGGAGRGGGGGGGGGGGARGQEGSGCRRQHSTPQQGH